MQPDLTQLEIDQLTERYERLCALERKVEYDLKDGLMLLSITGSKGVIRDKLTKLQSTLSN